MVLEIAGFQSVFTNQVYQRTPTREHRGRELQVKERTDILICSRYVLPRQEKVLNELVIRAGDFRRRVQRDDFKPECTLDLYLGGLKSRGDQFLDGLCDQDEDEIAFIRGAVPPNSVDVSYLLVKSGSLALKDIENRCNESEGNSVLWFYKKFGEKETRTPLALDIKLDDEFCLPQREDADVLVGHGANGVLGYATLHVVPGCYDRAQVNGILGLVYDSVGTTRSARDFVDTSDRVFDDLLITPLRYLLRSIDNQRGSVVVAIPIDILGRVAREMADGGEDDDSSEFNDPSKTRH